MTHCRSISVLQSACLILRLRTVNPTSNVPRAYSRMLTPVNHIICKTRNADSISRIISLLLFCGRTFKEPSYKILLSITTNLRDGGRLHKTPECIQYVVGPENDGLYFGVANAVAYYNNDRIHTALKMSPRDYAKSLQKPKPIMDRLFAKKVA